MKPLVVITSDLDQTLIFSPRATARLGGALPAEPVDVVEGRVVAEMALAVAAGIRALPSHAAFVPVTTRSVAQLRRLRLPVSSRYAVAAGGGIVLVDGEPDPEWQLRRQRTSPGAASSDVAHLLLLALADEPWLLRIARADDVFSYAIVDPSLVDPQQVAALAAQCARIGWRSTLVGRKLYVVPADLCKSTAVGYLLERIAGEAARDSGSFSASGAAPRHLAAGDTAFDREMVCAAHAAWVPAGSQLARDVDLPASVRVTPHPGHEAAAHIVAEWAAQAAHFRPGVQFIPQV